MVPRPPARARDGPARSAAALGSTPRPPDKTKGDIVDSNRRDGGCGAGWSSLAGLAVSIAPAGAENPVDQPQVMRASVVQMASLSRRSQGSFFRAAGGGGFHGAPPGRA